MVAGYLFWCASLLRGKVQRGTGPAVLGGSRCAVAIAVLLGGCTAAALPERCTLVLTTVLPVKIGSGHLYTTVKLNGIDLRMIIDTGAAATLISKATADRLGLSMTQNGEMSGIGGSTSAYEFEASTFQIGRLHGRSLPLGVAGTPFRIGDKLADGLFGADFLAGYDIDLDLRGKLGLFKVLHTCPFPASDLQEPVYRAPLESSLDANDARPTVIVHIGGHRLKALIDTGAPYSLIFRNAAIYIGLDTGKIDTRPDFIGGGIGPSGVKAVRRVMKPMTIGEITIANFPVAIVDQRSDDDGVDMLLGLDFFTHVHGWLSFSSHTLLMQYPPLPSPPRPAAGAP